MGEGGGRREETGRQEGGREETEERWIEEKGGRKGGE